MRHPSICPSSYAGILSYWLHMSSNFFTMSWTQHSGFITTKHLYCISCRPVDLCEVFNSSVVWLLFRTRLNFDLISIQLWFDSRHLFDGLQCPNDACDGLLIKRAQWHNWLDVVTMTYSFRPQCSSTGSQVDVLLWHRSVEWASCGRIKVQLKSHRNRIKV